MASMTECEEELACLVRGYFVCLIYVLHPYLHH